MVSKRIIWVIAAVSFVIIVSVILVFNARCNNPGPIELCAGAQSPSSDNPIILQRGEMDVSLVHENAMGVKIFNNGTQSFDIPFDLRFRCVLGENYDHKIVDVPFETMERTIYPQGRADITLIIDLKNDNPGFIIDEVYSCKIYIIKEDKEVISHPFILSANDNTQIPHPQSSFCPSKSYYMDLCG